MVERQGTLDTLHLRVERPEHAGDGRDVENDAVLERRIVEGMRAALGIGVTVSVEPTGSVPRSAGGKLQRTDDRRGL